MADNCKKYEAIWAIDAGDQLEALRNINVKGTRTRIFTKGNFYLVRSMHPGIIPPFAVVVDDTGAQNKIQPDFICNFRHVPMGRRSNV